MPQSKEDGHVAHRWRGDHGDVIISGLVRTTLFLVVLAALLYEVGAFAVNAVQLDEIADDAARRAAREAASGAPSTQIEQAVLASLASETGVVLEGVSHTADTATVTVARPPLFLFVDRIPGLTDRFPGRVTHTAGPPPPV